MRASSGLDHWRKNRQSHRPGNGGRSSRIFILAVASAGQVWTISSARLRNSTVMATGGRGCSIWSCTSGRGSMTDRDVDPSMKRSPLRFLYWLVRIPRHVECAAFAPAVDEHGVSQRVGDVGDDIARQAGRSIDHAESDAGDTATSGVQQPADDFVCIRFADGSTRSGVTSHPARLVVRRKTT